jgi:signal transduction histidine kinase
MNQELIRKQLLFAGLSEQDIEWLGKMAEPVNVSAGEYLMREGEPGDSLYLVMDGKFEVTKRSGNSEVVLAVRGAGEVFGEMSLLEQRPRSASARALTDSTLVKVSHAVFNQLLQTNPAATLAILRTVIARLRETEAMLRQNEKMASLGTLAAGLAHELNNPAAAAKRSSAQLRDLVSEWHRCTAELGMLGLTAAQNEILDTLREEMVVRSLAPAILDPLTRSDREGELQTWLEHHHIEQAWEIAPVLVGFDWNANNVERLSENFSPAQFAVVMRWLCVGCSIYALLDEVNKSAERISEIVKAVKSYSFLDQAPIQNIDVREGIENTLVILRNKLKEGIRITREYAANLPLIEAYGSELNQVWTNLIDNAIDAMQGKGELKIKTYRTDECVVVEITDDGPGIPAEIQSRIFEAFFTTKPPGIGTGLGLHISYNIIQRHRGTIQLTSQPGATTFQVKLPFQLKTP